MPFAPPVLPEGEEGSPGYRRTWLDREGPDAALKLRIMGFGFMVGGLVVSVLMVRGGWDGSFRSFALLVAIGGVVGTVTYFMASALVNGGATAMGAFLLPSGKSTPYEQSFSFQEAMLMRGDVDGALESYEAIIREQPGAVSPRLRAAEHYAKGGRNAARAAELFREVRSCPEVTTRDAIYASSRLVDLYDGPLHDPGRALVELRRIIELYPQSTVAEHARRALPGLKARLGSS